MCQLPATIYSRSLASHDRPRISGQLPQMDDHLRLDSWTATTMIKSRCGIWACQSCQSGLLPLNHAAM